MCSHNEKVLILSTDINPFIHQTLVRVPNSSRYHDLCLRVVALTWLSRNHIDSLLHDSCHL